MDFELSEEQEAVREAAAGVFAGQATVERVVEVEASEDRVDRALWAALADADLLGLAVPVEDGGAGLGLSELGLVLEQQGVAVAPVPLWSTLVLGALPLARFGSPAQRQAWLPKVAAGEVFLSGALADVAVSETAKPTVVAEAAGDAWRLTGTAHAVPQGHLASRVVVPARTGEGVLLALVDPRAAGATLERAETTNRELHPHLHLDGVSVATDEVLCGPSEGAAALTWLLEAARTGLCALQVGVTEEALRRTAAHLNEREQFGRPLSTFQGTMLRAADAAIDLEAMRVTAWQAAWRLDTDRPAAEAVAVALWQASDRGQRIVHSTQHLHGGLSADISYPIHRYFLWGKQIELLLGGPSVLLSSLGRMLAARADQVAGTAA